MASCLAWQATHPLLILAPLPHPPHPRHPPPVQTCGGKVLRCLTDKMEDIGDEACRKEVYYFEKVRGPWRGVRAGEEVDNLNPTGKLCYLLLPCYRGAVG